VSIGRVVAADPAEAAALEHEHDGTAPDLEPAAPVRRRRSAGAVLADVVPPAIVFALFIGVWYAFSYWLLDEHRRFLVPPPHKVINTAFLDSANRGALLDGLWLSTKVAVFGLFIAVVIGMTLAVVMSQAKWAERSIYPYAVALQTIPILALTPLIGFWQGFNFRSRVIVCVIIALFPIVANTLFGLQSVERGHHDLFRLHGAGRFTRLFKLQFPAALPAIFTGLRISAGLTVVGAIVGDFFFRQGPAGLGVLISNYQLRLQSEQMYGALILTILLGVVMFWIFGFIGHKVTGSWHDSGHRQS
jgi:NitT/TauT family transport system permease protein